MMASLPALFGIVALSVAACRHKPDEPPVVPGDMAWVTTPTDDPLQWRDAGFIELTTPIRPPTTEDGTAHIVVVLKVPDRHALRLSATAPLSFELPAGSTPDRRMRLTPASMAPGACSTFVSSSGRRRASTVPSCDLMARASSSACGGGVVRRPMHAPASSWPRSRASNASQGRGAVMEGSARPTAFDWSTTAGGVTRSVDRRIAG
jgi:hypothetical protein